MSQKINPISFRLGIWQVWDTILTTYNNNINFFQLHKKLILEKYIKNFFENNKLFLGSINWTFNNNNIFLIITYTKFYNTPIDIQVFSTKLNKVLRENFFLSPKIFLLKSSTWFNSSLLLSSYINFSIKKNNNNFKQVFKNTSKILSTKLNTQKIVYTTKGPVVLKLKGFKVKSSGRFDSSRSQMSNILQYKTGSLPMSRLNNYTEYTQKFIYTKSGICSLHVWLIFSL